MILYDIRRGGWEQANLTSRNRHFVVQADSANSDPQNPTLWLFWVLSALSPLVVVVVVVVVVVFVVVVVVFFSFFFCLLFP